MSEPTCGPIATARRAVSPSSLLGASCAGGTTALGICAILTRRDGGVGWRRGAPAPGPQRPGGLEGRARLRQLRRRRLAAGALWPRRDEGGGVRPHGSGVGGGRRLLRQGAL